MCNVPSFGDLVGAASHPFGWLRKEGGRIVNQLASPEKLARGIGITSANLGLPTTSELTGVEAAKEMERAQAAQEEQYRQEQALAEEERRRAAEQLALGATGTGRGRASTILTGSTSLLGTGSSARRTLMGG